MKEEFKDKNSYDIVDIGTGAGAIIEPLFLLNFLKKANGFTVDISPKAIEVAKENAQNLQVSDTYVRFLLVIYLHRL